MAADFAAHKNDTESLTERERLWYHSMLSVPQAWASILTIPRIPLKEYPLRIRAKEIRRARKRREEQLHLKIKSLSVAKPQARPSTRPSARPAAKPTSSTAVKPAAPRPPRPKPPTPAGE